jgi:large subunit ribosomal protein L19e
MNLQKKKALAAKVLGVGKKRIKFLEPRLEEIKEAITRQDIKDLYKDGAIVIKQITGRRSVKRNPSRSTGNVRKKIKLRKRKYVVLTRKLRRHLAELKIQKKVTPEEVTELRKRIRNKEFRGKAHFKEHIGGMVKK